MSHALESYHFIQDYQDIPQGVSDLVKHHHGNSYGIGLTSNTRALSDLSKIFALSSHFVHLLLAYKEGVKTKTEGPIITVLRQHYPDASALNTLKILEQVVNKKS